MKVIRFQLLILLILAFTVGNSCGTQSKSNTSAQTEVKNVILMIGDGMGVAQVSQHIVENELEPIQMERAEAVGLVRTFSANNRVTDSAAAGTAIATGTKTNNNMLGVDPAGNQLTSILSRLQSEGYRTGLVVTGELFDATPGAFYAHVNSRKSYDTITVQLLESGIDVAIGGGRKYLEHRNDGRDMLEEFRGKGYQVVLEQDQLQGVTDGRLAAFFATNELPYYIKGRGEYLPEATDKALEILSANTKAEGAKGFFLMVESSMIDYAGHDNLAEEMIGETRDFDNAVKRAFDFADANPGTLVIVTADHETGGLTMPANDSDFSKSDSGVSYRYSTGAHTCSLVPLFAYGTGAQNFSRVMDNTDISKIIARLTGI